MSRARRKSDRCFNNKQNMADISDVTINHFANSNRPGTTTRLKKNCINNIITEVKNLNLSKDDKTWDETLDGIDYVAKNYDHKKTSVVKKSNKQKKNSVLEDNRDDETGIIYPQEIWFLIARFIKPEDVGTFAGICMGCLHVVSTSNFWYTMYKRFYRKVDDLPAQLQPEYMVRNYGLRALVIRALYFMYPPFINKIKPQGIFDGDPHLLTKRQCVISWSQKNKNEWLFYFKLKQASGVKFGRDNGESDTKTNLLDLLEDITANVEDKCKVLEVTCLDYIPLPMITGQTLRSVSLSVSRRLQLNFGSGLSPYMGNNLIIFDPVVNLRVMDWWHPSYPYSNSPMSILSSSEGSTPFEEYEF